MYSNVQSNITGISSTLGRKLLENISFAADINFRTFLGIKTFVINKKLLQE